MLNRKLAAGLMLGYIVIFFIVPSVVLAQKNFLPERLVPKSCDQPGGCQSVCDLADLASNILNAGIYIAVFLAAFLFAWAGWKYITARGNEGEVTKARSIFADVAIGLVIILVGWLVVNLLLKTLTGIGDWNKLCLLLWEYAGNFA